MIRIVLLAADSIGNTLAPKKRKAKSRVSEQPNRRKVERLRI